MAAGAARHAAVLPVLLLVLAIAAVMLSSVVPLAAAARGRELLLGVWIDGGRGGATPTGASP